MKYHKQLSLQKWSDMSLAVKMANVGSEVIRAMKWKDEGNEAYGSLAFARSLELIDMSIEAEEEKARLKEWCRLREMWVDYWWGENQYQSKREQWQQYFFQFTYLARMRAN